MDHADHVALLERGVDRGREGTSSTWADLGSGWGAFTLALADILGPGNTIYSIDKDAGALRDQRQAMATRFPAVTVHYRNADFTHALDLPPLDGIVAANSLHFVREKSGVLRSIRDALKPYGRLVIVEYNVDQGNMWVPYPFSYPSWERMAAQAGFTGTRLLATRPSAWLREIYSAACERPA